MIYYNRYNDKIIIDKISDGVYEMIMDLQFCRCGYDDNDNIIMVDPSGGPYISVDNFDMNYFNKEWKDDVVSEIVIEKDKIILITKK